MTVQCIGSTKLFESRMILDECGFSTAGAPDFSRDHPIQSPRVRYALQFVLADVVEHESGTGGEVFHGR